MEEIWKDIEGFEGKYQVSSIGRVKSLPRIVNHSRFDCVASLKGKILTPRIQNEYQHVDLWRNNNGHKHYIHRLVAFAFIPNPHKKRTVNHKNGNPSDNRVENLEWATDSENNLHAFRELGRKGTSTGKFGKDHPASRAVVQYTKDGLLLQEYDSLNEAERETGINKANICSCCRGKNGHASSGGFIWKYADR